MNINTERLCVLCKHHKAVAHAMPSGQSVTVHQCDVSKGWISPVDGNVMVAMDCGSMRLSDICGVQGKLFEPDPNRKN